MAFVRKMKEGDKTPTLYSMYGKLYDFDELQRRADSGLNGYLGSLRRGLKDYDKFMEAYSDIMNGIKDGTITFNNGMYHDSLGRYDNTSEGKVIRNGNKDHYGLIASYIFDKQKGLLEYTSPEDKSKIKWDGNSSVGNLVMHHIYNSDNGDVKNFINLDELDPKTNKRGLTNRTNTFLNGLTYARNNLGKLNGISDEDLQTYGKDLDDIIATIQRLKTITPLNYLALSKLLGNLDFEGMFTTIGNSPTLETPATPTQLPVQPPVLQPVAPQLPTGRPTFGNSYSLNFSERYKSATLNTLGNYLNSLSNDSILNALSAAITDRNFQLGLVDSIKRLFPGRNINFSREFTINTLLTLLQKKGALKEETDGYWSVPGTKIWYNPQSKTVGRFVTYSKNGGVIKAQRGTNSNIFFNADKFDYGYNTYLNQIWQQTPVLDWMKQHYTGDTATLTYSDFVKRNVNGRYTAKINDFLNNQRYTGSDDVFQFNTSYLNNGDTPNYVLFGNNSNDYNGRTGGVVYNLGLFNRPSKAIGTGDSYNNDKTKAYIDNALGALTYSRVASLTNPGLKTGEFGVWGDYWKSLGNTGAYYYIADGDTSGRGLWIPTSDTTLNGYQPFDTPEVATPPIVTPKPPKLEVPEQEVPKEPADGTDVRTRTLNPDKQVDIKGKFSSIFPDLLDAGRLFYSIKTNNRIANTIRPSLSPAILKTYERFSPITGAFLEMLFRSRQGADGQSLMSRPFTSDASLQSLRLLEGLKYKDNLAYLGFLADDKEIKRTANEALLRLEDNAARRTDISNKNTLSINQANKEIAQLEATRLKQNWQSVDNFLRGISDRSRLKTESDIERRNQFRLQTESDNIEQQYKNAVTPIINKMREYSRTTGKDFTEMPEYSNYEKFMQEAQNWRKANLYKVYAGVYGYGYTDPYLNKTLDDIRASTVVYHRG